MDQGTQHSLKVKQYETILEKRFSDYKLLICVCLSSVALLFLTLTGFYVMSQQHLDEGEQVFRLHPVFYLNALNLFLTSITLLMCNRYFAKDNYTRYKISLLSTFVYGVVFLLGQIGGTILLWRQGYTISHNTAVFWHVMVALHGLHLAGGLGFLFLFKRRAFRSLKEFATSIVYFTDPVEKLELVNLNYYWHFLTLLWCYLLVFFALA